MKLALFLLALPALAQWPGIPSDPPGSTRAAGIRLLVRPEPMDIARGILATSGKLDIGRWQVIPLNQTTTLQTITNADIALAIPQVTFLDRPTLLLLLTKKSGGWRKNALHIAMLLGLAVPTVGNAVKIGVTATKAIAGSLTILEIFRNDLNKELPDLTTLELALPASITLKPGESVVISAWAAHVRGAKPYTAFIERTQ